MAVINNFFVMIVQVFVLSSWKGFCNIVLYIFVVLLDVLTTYLSVIMCYSSAAAINIAYKVFRLIFKVFRLQYVRLKTLKSVVTMF